MNDNYDVIGSGEPLLLIPGALVSRAMWQPQIASFSSTYQVIACDLPAHGEALDIAGDYSITKLSESIIQLLDSIGISQTHVCGHSLGGMVAQQLAVTYPERVRKMVLAETAYGTQNSVWERIQTSFAWTFLKLTSQRTLVRLSAKQYGSLNAHVGEFVRAEMGRYGHRTSVRVMSAALSFSGKQQLKDISVATLVLVAENNKQTHAQGREMADNIPNAKFEIIPQSHHLLNLDNPDVFNETVLAFLQETESDRQPAA